MAVSPNVLAGLAAALGGGMKAFNAQTAEDEDKRRFGEQQAHQKAMLQRSLVRDELEDLKTKDALTQSAQARALSLASNFGGQEVDAAALQDVPHHLRGLIAKPVDRPVPLAASTQLTGFASMPGAQKQEGAVNVEDFEAKAATKPDERFEIQVPNSERVRLQEQRDQGALTRAQLMGQQRSGQLEQQNKQFYDRLAQDRELGNQRIMATLAGVAARGAGRDTMTSGQEFNAINTLNRVYNTNTKSARVIQDQFARMDAAMRSVDASGGTKLNAPSQAILVTFQKILDPESVVRESEYARSPQGLALLNRLQGSLAAVQAGGPGVPPEQLREFYSLAKTFNDRAVASANAEKSRITSHAKRFNLPMDLIVADYDAAPGGSTATATDATPTASPTAGPRRIRTKMVNGVAVDAATGQPIVK